MRGPILAAALGALLLAPAGAQGDTVFHLPLEVEGGLTLEYRGTPEAGCAAALTCGVSGLAHVSPSREENEITVFEHRRRVTVALDAFGFGAVTRAEVRREHLDGRARVCTDAGTPTFFAVRTSRRDRVEVGLRGFPETFGEPFSTRCQGPVGADLEAALPSRRVPLAQLRRGSVAVDLRGVRPFQAPGLAGTLRSTVVLRLGRPDRPPRERTEQAGATLRARYRIERVAGTVRTDISGVANPDRCEPLDVCGLRGAVTRTFGGGEGTLDFVARGRRELARLRAALGVGPRRTRAGVRGVGASGTLRPAGGGIATDLTRADGSTGCRDRAVLPIGTVSAFVEGGRLRVRYGEAPAAPSRCGGPPNAIFGTVAIGDVPVAHLRRRRIVVRLDRAPAAGDEAFRARGTSDLVLVLRRESVRTVRSHGEIAVIR